MALFGLQQAGQAPGHCSRVVRAHDGGVNVHVLVSHDGRGRLQMLLLDRALGALVSENQVHLQGTRQAAKARHCSRCRMLMSLPQDWPVQVLHNRLHSMLAHIA